MANFLFLSIETINPAHKRRSLVTRACLSQCMEAETHLSPDEIYLMVADWNIPSTSKVGEQYSTNDCISAAVSNIDFEPISRMLISAHLHPVALSRPSRASVHTRPPETGSGRTEPAGRAVAGSRPSYPSHIRVQAGGNTGRRRPEVSLPRSSRRGAGVGLRRPEPDGQSITNPNQGLKGLV